MACLISLLWLFIANAASVREIPPGNLARVVSGARAGEVLLLQAGVHQGPVAISKTLRLVGKPGAVIQGSGIGTVVEIKAPGVVISNLMIRNAGSDLARDDAVVLLNEVSGVTVRDCRVEARAFGIYLRGGGRNRIYGNQVHGEVSLSVARRGNGIHLWHSSENSIIGNHLRDVRDGIYLSFAHRNRISENNGRSLRYGVHYMYSEQNTLSGNDFREGRGGMALMFSKRNRVEGNRALENRDFGILCLYLEESELVKNRLAGNGRGLFLENSAHLRCIGNGFLQNGTGVYLTAGSEANTFLENHFEGNLVQVFHSHAGRNRWAQAGRGNYWSDYSGFDWDGDGVGETPYRLQTTASALMARRPVTRWFWKSPIFALLDWWDSLLGSTLGSTGPLDRFPLLESPGS